MAASLGIIPHFFPALSFASELISRDMLVTIISTPTKGRVTSKNKPTIRLAMPASNSV
jgi:hypothetical protein